MTAKDEQDKESAGRGTPEPRGFGEHTRGLAGEYAHEQGWGLSQDERSKLAPGSEGGSDYEYGAQDFGDEPIDTSSAKPTAKDVKAILKE